MTAVRACATALPERETLVRLREKPEGEGSRHSRRDKARGARRRLGRRGHRTEGRLGFRAL